MKEIAEPRFKTVRIKVPETLYNYVVKKLHWAVRDTTKIDRCVLGLSHQYHVAIKL